MDAKARSRKVQLILNGKAAGNDALRTAVMHQQGLPLDTGEGKNRLTKFYRSRRKLRLRHPTFQRTFGPTEKRTGSSLRHRLRDLQIQLEPRVT
jgi:hypothetical protein